jgi:hypothetical protein
MSRYLNPQPTPLTLRNLLETPADYVVPMYQRNYAWGEAEITQLISDVIDYQQSAFHGGNDQSRVRYYYIGTLVVFDRKVGQHWVHETIDGQQRLTTLVLLAAYLRRRGVAEVGATANMRLRFESRPRSQRTLMAFCDAGVPEPDSVSTHADGSVALEEGYHLISSVIDRSVGRNPADLEAFAAYFLDHVSIMRVSVPPRTDLNHYFEIMNSRGEQLEKHEVLKSRMMSHLPEDDRRCLELIWEVCANMERYVQMGFETTSRTALFGADWNELQVSDFDALKAIVDDGGIAANVASDSLSLDQILRENEAFSPGQGEQEGRAGESGQQFHSVINFPNFLLQVLRVFLLHDMQKPAGTSVKLDDKTLLYVFDEHLLRLDDPLQRVAHIKSFVFSLLRCRYLFDQYVIKREYGVGGAGGDRWSLQKLVRESRQSRGSGSGSAGYRNTFSAVPDERVGADMTLQDGNRRILMLQAAFHVSAPALNYKYWLAAALHFLSSASSVDSVAYLDWLESVARRFVFDNYLSDERLEYDTLIYQDQATCRTRVADLREEGMARQLSYGGIRNNFVFNYLDYLLWNAHRRETRVDSFKFTFRSSVEHFYPQNTHAPGELDEESLHCFGNLCLISHSKNSRLSNRLPVEKASYFRQGDIDSLKLHFMIDMMQRAGNQWDASTIAEHGRKMVALLIDDLTQAQSRH